MLTYTSSLALQIVKFMKKECITTPFILNNTVCIHQKLLSKASDKPVLCSKSPHEALVASIGSTFDCRFKQIHIISQVPKQSDGATDEFQQAFGCEGKEFLKERFSIDNALEDKIYDLYDSYIQVSNGLYYHSK